VAAALACLGAAAVFVLQMAQAPEDEPDPLVWQALLTRPPVRLFWEDPTGASRLEHLPQKQELRVTADYFTLVGLGSTRRMGYQLEVRVSQLRWPGGAGVFLGGHPIRQGDREGMEYQFIEFTSQSPPNKPRVCTLRRGSLRVWKGRGGGHSTDEVGIASTRLPVPDTDECLLQITVGYHGLEKVRWDGRDCTELTALRANDQFPEASYVGAFGVFTSRSHAVYRNAQWMLFERKAP
jgi:hypothetical protein